MNHFKAKMEGVGLGLRTPFLDDLLALGTDASLPGWFEVVPENFLYGPSHLRRKLDAIAERFTIVPHAVSTSLAGTEPLNTEWLVRLKAFADAYDAPFVSDHMCWSKEGDVHLHDLLPVALNMPEARHLAARAKRMQDFLERPVLLENIVYYSSQPDSSLRLCDFVCEVIELSGTGLLLDLSNLWINAQNQEVDLEAFLSAMPWNKVGQLHVAGNRFDSKQQIYVDDHASPVRSEVKELLASVAARIPQVPILLERDQNLPELTELLCELESLEEVRQSTTPEPSCCDAKDSKVRPRICDVTIERVSVVEHFRFRQSLDALASAMPRTKARIQELGLDFARLAEGFFAAKKVDASYAADSFSELPHPYAVCLGFDAYLRDQQECACDSFLLEIADYEAMAAGLWFEGSNSQARLRYYEHAIPKRVRGPMQAIYVRSQEDGRLLSMLASRSEVAAFGVLRGELDAVAALSFVSPEELGVGLENLKSFLRRARPTSTNLHPTSLPLNELPLNELPLNELPLNGRLDHPQALSGIASST